MAQNMKIYSWNILFRNKELDHVFGFISGVDFDIFCLQEVPDVFLARLKTLPYHLSFRIDVERLFGSARARNYVVTLSKHSIVSQGEIPFPDYAPLLPWRTKLFVRLMPSKLFSKMRGRGGLYTDLVVRGETVRVFNLHLILAHPAWRLAEFDMAMQTLDPLLPTIVCGDFNTLEMPHITPLNWILGGSISDALLYTRERHAMEKRFAERGLTNPLRGKTTHPLSHSQLDHILTSKHFSLRNASVISNRYGSDHHSIFAETLA